MKAVRGSVHEDAELSEGRSAAWVHVAFACREKHLAAQEEWVPVELRTDDLEPFFSGQGGAPRQGVAADGLEGLHAHGGGGSIPAWSGSNGFGWR